MERPTSGLHFGLISRSAFVCWCQCLATSMGLSALIIPAQPDLKGNAGADEDAAKQSCSNTLTAVVVVFWKGGRGRP